jgi:Uma2 family endonuclease
MSLGDFLGLYAQHPFELIEGEVIAKMPSVSGHSKVIKRLMRALLPSEDAGLGEVFSETTFILADTSDWVRGSRVPDLMWVSTAKLEAFRALVKDADQKPFVLIPDLVVEVVSANDSFGALIDKVGLYLRDGVRLVWVIDPQARRVVVYTPDSPMRVLTESDTLTGGEVLPEFSAPLSELLG